MRPSTRSLEPVGQGRLGDEAEAERRHGDAELGAGQLHVEVGHARRARPGPACCPPSASGSIFCVRDADQPELDGHEEAVGQQQDDGEQERDHREPPSGSGSAGPSRRVGALGRQQQDVLAGLVVGPAQPTRATRRRSTASTSIRHPS